MINLSKAEIERLLLNQSNKVMCEMQLMRIKKKYAELQNIWKSYALSSKRTYTQMSRNMRTVMSNLEKEAKETTRTKMALNTMEKKVERGKRKGRSVPAKRYSPSNYT